MEEIYEILSKELCLDQEEAIEKELRMEEKVCYANPYLYQVFGKLRHAGKKAFCGGRWKASHMQYQFGYETTYKL